jgi:protein ImuB
MPALSWNAIWLAIYLPRLNTDRLIRAGLAPEGRALAVYTKEANAYALTGVDARASALGLRLAMSLADARAIHPNLAAVEADPDEDARTLDNIAAWCERFTPVVVLDPPCGLFLDITGCAHLFGGEGALRDQIIKRLCAQGFGARAALAPTPGAAWALARYGTKETLFLAERMACASTPGEGRSNAQTPDRLHAPHPLASPSRDRIATPLTLDSPAAERPVGRRGIEEALAPLPVEALRLEPEATVLLHRIGLKSIGLLLNKPRAPFAARLGEHSMLRLDQALGRATEALTPRRPSPPVFALRRFLEPLFSVETILEATKTLCEDVVEKLDLRGSGARRAVLHLFGVDGRDRVIEIGVSRPEREVKTLMRLFKEKLNRAAENLNAEFGIEAARLDVVQLERFEDAPRTLVAVEEATASAGKISAIVDVLSARLGPQRVLRPKFAEAHAPEKASAWRAALGSKPLLPRGEGAGDEGRSSKQTPDRLHAPHPLTPPPRDRVAIPPFLNSPAAERPVGRRGVSRDGVMRRPLTLFARPQSIDAIATVPDGPPIRFRWRRVLREVVRAEGPERISGDWMLSECTRDYYRVEDKDGRRYWLYREGLYGESDEPHRWFVHGLFA